jgi:hypothetical protein
MDRQKQTWLWINIIGGILVLGSYALGLAAHPGQANALWGNVPQFIRAISTITMLPAALGYLAYSIYLIFVLDLETATINVGAGFKAFNLLYLLVLLPSALWMPLTFAYLANPLPILWLADRLVLAVVGLAGLGILSALMSIQPRKPIWAFRAAIVGCIFFCVQTAVMDALIWSNLFLK